MEHQEFIVDGIQEYKLLRWMNYDRGELENNCKIILIVLRHKVSVLSQMYSILKGVGLDLDGEFKWDEDFTMEDQEAGRKWSWLGKEGTKDKEHYWRLLEFAINTGLTI